MSIFKDFREDNEGYRLRSQITYLLSPKVWARLHASRKQRADRGWSNHDTWAAGEHIAKMTAEILQHLNDNAYTDWPAWFKYNVQEKGSYKSLQAVIDDINQYLAFIGTSWADGLTCDRHALKDGGQLKMVWRHEKTGKKVSDKQITARIKSHSGKEKKTYEKATNAMQFFGKNFSSFWD